MTDETIKVPLHRERVDGPNAEWQVVAGDWRDRDTVLVLDGAQVYPTDANHQAVEPDWGQGWELRWGDKNFVEIPPDRPINPVTRMYFRGVGGRPPDIIADAYLQGRVLYGVIVARDLQRHNS